MKTRVISLRLKRGPAARLERLAKILRRSMGETAALLLEEKLQEEEFAFIEFRDSSVGRQAYIQGTSLAVWEVMLVAGDLDMDVSKVARHLDWPVEKVHAAFAYAAASRDNIEPILEGVRSLSVEDLQSILPWVREVTT